MPAIAASDPARTLVHLRDLARELIVRELKIRYKRSYLGVAWSLLNPLSQLIIFSFLFRAVIPLGVQHYTAFVFAGVLSWSWFSGAITAAPSVVTGNPELVRRPGFPTEVLPIVTVSSNAIHFLIALPLLLAVSVLDGGTIGPSLLALPLVLAVQFCFTLGLAYAIAALHVSFRDTQHIVTIAVMLAFYVTPVFYDASVVPERFRAFYLANPMAVLIGELRGIMLEDRWPALMPMASVTLVSILLLMAGAWLYKRESVRFAEEL
jgi:lipopolysaccharide transport system permease protein